MKKCSKCNESKSKKAFHIRSDRPGKTYSYCKPCMHKVQYERQIKHKKQAVEYLGGSCKLCNYNKSISALVFHHRDPSQKEITISKLRSYSFKRIKVELDKCDLLCANCHAEFHYTY